MFKYLLPLSIPLAMILISPSCQHRFQSGVIDITDTGGHRTLHSDFHNGQFGKIDGGVLFRAQLQDGSVVLIESKQAEEPEAHK